VEVGVSAQGDSDDGGEGEQQREGGEKGVVGQERDEIAALVVAELLDHGDRERDDVVTLLPAVDPTNRTFDGIHGSALATSCLRIPKKRLVHADQPSTYDTARPAEQRQ
jgi:hypothetical protein